MGRRAPSKEKAVAFVRRPFFLMLALVFIAESRGTRRDGAECSRMTLRELPVLRGEFYFVFGEGNPSPSQHKRALTARHLSATPASPAPQR
jgi:hypothetical protein